MDEISVLCKLLQQTHLQRPLLRISTTARDKMSRGGNPENRGCRNFGRRRHQQLGFQRSLLRMSPTTGDETSWERIPENGGCCNFGNRGRLQSGFQYTYRSRPPSPESFNENHNTSCESLSHLTEFVVCL